MIKVIACTVITIFTCLSAQALQINCVPFEPEGYPSRSAKLTGTIEVNEQSVSGTFNVVLKHNRVGHEPVVRNIDQLSFEGRLETVGKAKVIHIRGQQTNKSAEIDYMMVTIYPNGDRLKRPNGGFVRSIYGFYRPHHCTAN